MLNTPPKLSTEEGIWQKKLQKASHEIKECYDYGIATGILNYSEPMHDFMKCLNIHNILPQNNNW